MADEDDLNAAARRRVARELKGIELSPDMIWASAALGATPCVVEEFGKDRARAMYQRALSIGRRAGERRQQGVGHDVSLNGLVDEWIIEFAPQLKSPRRVTSVEDAVMCSLGEVLIYSFMGLFAYCGQPVEAFDGMEEQILDAFDQQVIAYC
jgi:hypothetical protein